MPMKMLTKEYPDIQFIAHNLLQPDIKAALFDDAFGWNEIIQVLMSPSTIIYGIFGKAGKFPVAIIFFTQVIPFRCCEVFAAVFDKALRNTGIIKSAMEKIEVDMKRRFSVHGCSAYIVGENPASDALLKKIGFEKVGTKKEAIFCGGRYLDQTTWHKLLPDEEK